MPNPILLRRRLGEFKHLALAFDFDGTISELASTPNLASVSGGMRRILVRIERFSSVSIVSSRPLKVLLDKLSFLKRAKFYGLHGLETPRGKHRVSKRELRELESAKKLVKLILPPFKGAWIENKTAGFTVHYRATAPSKHNALEARLVRGLKDLRLRVYRGRKAVEVLAPGIPTKATTLEYIHGKLSPDTLLLVFGDDDADEEAFRALKRKKNVLCVAVGRKKTAAAFSVKNPREVERFLRDIINLRSQTNPSKYRSM